MKRLVYTVMVALLALLFDSQKAVTKEQVTIESIRITDNIYMLRGKGGNMGVFIGKDGTFLVDDQFAPLSDKIITAITDLGGEVPKFIINTHYHGDHTGGNENFGKYGALIVSHDNVRERLKNGSYIEVFDKKRGPVPAIGLPVITFADEITFHLNNELVKIAHAPGSHTDGDAFIVFESANVVHAGDLVFNGFYPFIDVSHGGSLQGMIDGVKRLLTFTDTETVIIPGHGPVADRDDVVEFLAMLETAQERLSKLKKEGKSVQEVIALNPLADFEDEWGGVMFTGAKWIEIVFPGI